MFRIKGMMIRFMKWIVLEVFGGGSLGSFKVGCHGPTIGCIFDRVVGCWDFVGWILFIRLSCPEAVPVTHALFSNARVSVSGC